MKVKTFLITSFAILLSFSVLSGISSAQEERKIKMDEYRTMIADWQQREAAAQTKLAECNTSRQSLESDLSSLDGQIRSEWNEIYRMIGTDEAGVASYRRQLEALERQVDGLAALSSEELFRRRGEIEEIENKLAEHKMNKIYALSEMRDRVARIDGKIMRLKNRMPQSLYDDYNVVRGDYLWKISKKPDIYDDPMQWMKIYTYNREMIKDPDLIYPNWVLKIPRRVGPNEYVVMKGEYLHKIASNPDVFGNPTQWTKLYEANKDIISDPNLIYPHQILVVPRD